VLVIYIVNFDRARVKRILDKMRAAYLACRDGREEWTGRDGGVGWSLPPYHQSPGSPAPIRERSPPEKMLLTRQERTLLSAALVHEMRSPCTARGKPAGMLGAEGTASSRGVKGCQGESDDASSSRRRWGICAENSCGWHAF